MKRKTSAKQLDGLRGYAAERKAERANLLKVLREESARCSRLHTFPDESTAPNLLALALLAKHFHSTSVRFEGVTFRVTYSIWRGAVRDPETGEPLVLFACSAT